MLRVLSLGGLALAALATCLPAHAGLFGHRHSADCGCAAVEPGCSAFEPACPVEPSCGVDPCCPAPCIKYRHKHAHRHAHGCHACPEPTYETVLQATSPETCRTVAVPVCLPICCDGCPCESSRCTLFGCGEVRFDYACGVSVLVRFQKGGDILVTYVGF